MKLAFADAHRYVGDPRDDGASGRGAARPRLPRGARAADRPAARAGLRPRRAAAGAAPSTSAPPTQRGMMVSLIQSNYMGFGSGVVVPGTGISLQNRGAGFSLAPGHPNEIGGGKRPFHTIIPGFLTRDGAPLAAFGVMGGPIQPPGHVQTLVRLLTYGMNPQAALDAPRWKVERRARRRSRADRRARVARRARRARDTRSPRSPIRTWTSARASSSSAPGGGRLRRRVRSAPRRPGGGLLTRAHLQPRLRLQRRQRQQSPAARCAGARPRAPRAAPSRASSRASAA